MATKTAQDVLTRAGRVLNDLTNVTWSASEVLDWINDGQRAIVTELPQAYPVRMVFPLTPNDVRQDLPANAFRLIGVKRNMGTNGTTPGRTIMPISFMQLYNIDPSWPTAAAAPAIKHYAYDPATPYTMWVYPAPNAALQVEAWVSMMPPDVGSISATLTLDDSFFNPLIDYVLARCYQKNANVQGSTDLIAGYLSSFEAQIAKRNAGDRSTEANTSGPNKAGPT